MAEAKKTAAAPLDEQAKATPIELAMLAALIDPGACRGGNARDALFRAIALFQESAALCEEMVAKNYREQIEMLSEEAIGGSGGGADKLRRVMLKLLTPPTPILTLTAKDAGDDTLRPYLEEHCNLEGKSKTGRKSWSRVRTVLDNLKAWHVDSANTDNIRNAASIEARETREEEQARARGCTVEQLRAGGAASYPREQWQDWEQNWKGFQNHHEILADGKVTGYQIPRGIVDSFIEWKRRIRKQKGGMTAVRPLTRDQVFPKPVKKKNPKRPV